MVVPPLSPADVADLPGVTPEMAVDAYLVSGGLPLVLGEWEHGDGALAHLERVLTDPTSALLVSGVDLAGAPGPAVLGPQEIVDSFRRSTRDSPGGG